MIKHFSFCSLKELRMADSATLSFTTSNQGKRMGVRVGSSPSHPHPFSENCWNIFPFPFNKYFAILHFAIILFRIRDFSPYFPFAVLAFCVKFFRRMIASLKLFFAHLFFALHFAEYTFAIKPFAQRTPYRGIDLP